MSYPNLEAEMARMGYTKEDIARCLGLHISGVYLILSGKRRLPITSAIKIRDSLFPKMRLDYLFDIEPVLKGPELRN